MRLGYKLFEHRFYQLIPQITNDGECFNLFVINLTLFYFFTTRIGRVVRYISSTTDTIPLIVKRGFREA